MFERKTKDTGPKKTSKRKNRKKILITVGICAVLVTAGIVTLVILQKKNAAENADSGVTYSSYTVETGTIADTIEESGSVAIGSSTPVTSDYDLTIDASYVAVGDSVTAGTKLASIDASSLSDLVDIYTTQLEDIDNQISSSDYSRGNAYLSSTAEGRVKELHIAAGDDVQNSMNDYGLLLVISTDGCMKVVFTPENDAAITLGETYTVAITQSDVTTTDTGVITAKNDDGTYTLTIADDTYDYGASAVISNADGTEIGAGTLDVSAPYPVTLSSGMISSVAVAENDYVYEGTTLFYLEEGQQSDTYLSLLAQRSELWNEICAIKELIDNPYITAESDGVITATSLSAGSKITAGSEMYQIATEDGFVMTLSVDEDDISSISIGQTAVITISALDDVEVNGSISAISYIGTSSNEVTTYTVTVAVDDTEGLLSGMNADCVITIDSADNAVLVPIGAIQTVQEKKYVLLDDGSESGTLTEVELGLVTDTYAQVTSGLSEGDAILIATYSSTEENSSSGMMMGVTSGSMPSGGGDITAGSMPSGGSGGFGGDMPSGNAGGN